EGIYYALDAGRRGSDPVDPRRDWVRHRCRCGHREAGGCLDHQAEAADGAGVEPQL
ncbi:MAG: hypothetical protein AVDCRST_MAG23-2278, partial [uncultured Sphingosinicella sp.]